MFRNTINYDDGDDEQSKYTLKTIQDYNDNNNNVYICFEFFFSFLTDVDHHYKNYGL